MTDRFVLREVKFIPEEFEEGIIYYSEKYKIAGHLCACGCGEKVMTRVAPAAWSVTPSGKGVSMWPSIGSWQLACKSHYVIREGQVRWAGQWSDSQIEAGRANEIKRKFAYYDSKRVPWYKSLWNWLRDFWNG